MTTAGSDEPVVVKAPEAATKIMRLRYAGSCSTCGAALAKGERAEWDRSTRKVTCVPCRAAQAAEEEPSSNEGEAAGDAVGTAPELPSFDAGEAGASAAREFERRHDRRQRQITDRWGRLAPVVNFLSEDPQSTTAWARGASGERRLASHLGRTLGESAILLHDRKVPRTRGNIDHLAVAASGVWVIDAKNYEGRVERRDNGGWFNTEYRLFGGGRDRTRLVEGLGWQLDAVEVALGGVDVPIHGALCFTAATWGLFAKPFQIGAIWVAWADALTALVRAPGELEHDAVLHVASLLSTGLPPSSPTQGPGATRRP